ncbi:hypothetical protein [Rhizobium mongolense]|uniref:hypothetical protein n=1 Tax=Rhizobium mongolense TaxID=57676 RepID=UPI003F627641
MERHIAAQLAILDAVREWDGRRTDGDVSSVVYANALLDAAREEEAARFRIVRYEPRDDREEKLKLTYIAAYLMATKQTLKTVEMAAVIGAT